MTPVPPEKWIWCGYPGHFIGASSCRLHLHTRVGKYRISTVGDYHPQDAETAQEIGSGRLYETFVFPVSGKGQHGEGKVKNWEPLDDAIYNDDTAAERGHMKMCRKYARKQQS